MRTFNDDRGTVVEIGRVQYVGHTYIQPEQVGTEYDEQAEKWLGDTDSHLIVRLDRTGKYFPGDKEERDVYEITLECHGRFYTFNFGQSLHHSQQWESDPYQERLIHRRSKKRHQPSAYSILTCLESYSPGTFEEFCDDFGYDTDSREAEKTWRACVDQYLTLSRMYSHKELESLSVIQ